MSDEQFDDIQKLIRLKRYEEPPAGYEAYTERFVEEFGRRQRAELLQQSSRGLLWERVSTYVGEFGQAKWLYASVTAVLVAAAVFLAGANFGGAKVSGDQFASETSGGSNAPLVHDADGQPRILEASAPEFVNRPVTIPGSANGGVQPVSTRPGDVLSPVPGLDTTPGEIDAANVIIYREF